MHKDDKSFDLNELSKCNFYVSSTNYVKYEKPFFHENKHNLDFHL